MISKKIYKEKYLIEIVVFDKYITLSNGEILDIDCFKLIFRDEKDAVYSVLSTQYLHSITLFLKENIITDELQPILDNAQMQLNLKKIN